MAKRFSDQVRDGMDVYDVAEEKVGTVHEVYEAATSEASTSGGGYLRVPTGFLGMGAEHHIPFSAIRDVRDETIYLSIAKDRLDELGYGEAPMETDPDDDGPTTVERTATPNSMTTDPRPTPTDAARRKLELREEELIARKRTVETGAVNLRTQVVSEEQTLDVPVTREEITIERHAVDRRPSERAIGQGETISIPVHEEQVQVDKKAVVYEEVSVGTREMQETQHLSETVRREEAVIDKEGKVEVEGETKTPDPRRP